MGVGVVAAGLGPVACHRASAALGLTGPADTIRAFKLWRIVQENPKPVVLPALSYGRPTWQLATVVRVVDADTYEVQVGRATARVRLLQVDAPEHDQPFGAQATDSVRALVLGKYVQLLSGGADGYGRTLARVKLRPVAFSTPPGVSLDSLLVARGWAWAYAPSGQLVALASQQQRAAAAGRGLWKCGTTRVVRPGIWRAYNAQEKATAWAGCSW
ncbi:hypothetical protein E4631_15685 [Hymenobacter sp. UV11]|nr:hypothetical protein E4631_15685 [Hymenobacter sp. UV11]